VGIRALILSPTRELALQTLKFAKELGKYTDLRLCLLVGGDSMDEQFAALAHNPDVVMATPGRLLHHLEEVVGMGAVVWREYECGCGSWGSRLSVGGDGRTIDSNSNTNTDINANTNTHECDCECDY